MVLAEVLATSLSCQVDMSSIRASSKAGPLVLEAVASKCPRLQVLNMNYTVATPQSLMSVLFGCSNLEVLKIAGIPKLVSPDILPSQLLTDLIR